MEIDGYPLAEPQRPTRVLAGTHRGTVLEGDQPVAEEVITVNVGQTHSARPTAATADSGPNLFERAAARPVAKDWRFWTALGVVAAIGVTLVVLTIVDDDTGAGAMPLVSW